jgi:phage-related minor tail protein
MVGERGPELFTPKHGGSIVPNNALGGGTTNVVVNVDASGSSVQGDQTQGKQLGLAVSAAVQAELIRQQRPGGLLASTRR